MSSKFTTSVASIKSQPRDTFHTGAVAEFSRTTGLLSPEEHEQWAIDRGRQLADYRRRCEPFLVFATVTPTADETLITRWEALQNAVRSAA